MVYEIVAATLAARVDCDVSEIDRDTTFVSLGVDSLETMELVMELEEKLDRGEIELTEKVATVGELVDFIEALPQS